MRGTNRRRMNFALITSFLILVTIAGRCNDARPLFKCKLGTAQHAPYPPPYLSKEVRHYYDFVGNRNVIYHDMDLIGRLKIENTGSKILKLAPINYDITDIVTLEYAPLKTAYFESLRIGCDKNQVDSMSNEKTIMDKDELLLPPKGSLEIVIKCDWKELSGIHLDTLKLRCIFDNSESQVIDKKISPIQYESESFIFYKIPMETKLDSIMYYDFKVNQLYAENKLQDAADLCFKMLKIDSTLYNPHFMITSLYWKLEKYDLAIEWAQKTIEVLRWWKEFGDAYSTSDQGQYALMLYALIEKCKNRERWDPMIFITQ